MDINVISREVPDVASEDSELNQKILHEQESDQDFSGDEGREGITL